MLCTIQGRVQMITRDAARQLVQDYLDQSDPYSIDPLELQILDEYTREEEFGWVFFYDSKLHLETAEIQHMLAGNAPIIVNKDDGSLHFTGSAFQIDKYIQDYQDQLDVAQGRWGLVILDRGDDFIATLNTIRSVLGLTAAEVTALRTNVPGVIRRGSRTELRGLVAGLRARGVYAEIQESATAS